MKKRIFTIVQNTLISIFLPFLLYYVMTTVCQKESLDTISFVIYYCNLILFIFTFSIYQCEKIQDFLGHKIGQMKFICSICYILLSLSLIFTSYYFCLYIDNPLNFNNVSKGNIFEQYYDFFFYSLGIFVMNNQSSIESTSFYAKLFVSTEILTVFVLLVVIFANYKELNNPFNEHTK